MTSDGGSRSFSYDLDNQLIQAANGTAGTPANWGSPTQWNAFQWSGPATTYLAYDPAGRLHQTDNASGTEQYVYDGDALVLEYDGSGTILRRYVPGQGADETLVWYEGSNLSTPNWLHTDEQGSIIATSDGSGTGTLHVYSATGEPQGGFSNGAPIFRYTGQVQLAAIGLYYYKARVYDPGLGRFLQTDPEGYAQGLNMYAYAMNNYPNASDPSGMCDPIYNATESIHVCAPPDLHCRYDECLTPFDIDSGTDPLSCTHSDVGCIPDLPAAPLPLQKNGTNQNMCPSIAAFKLAALGVASGTGSALAGAAIDIFGAATEVAGGGPEDPAADAVAYYSFKKGTALEVTGATTAATSALFLATHGAPREGVNQILEAGADKALKPLPESLKSIADYALDKALNYVEDKLGVLKQCPH